MKRKNQANIEENVRRRFEKKYEDRAGLTQHFISYALTNIVLWAIWLFTGAAFPWPLFITLFWGIGMLSHYVAYHNKHGYGARKRETEIEAEVMRQAHLARAQAELQGWRDSDEYAPTYADVYELDNYQERGLRLSDDGELAYPDLDSDEEDERLRQSER